MRVLFYAGDREMEKCGSELRKLAQSAKNRLKHGYWHGAANGAPVAEEGRIGYAVEEEMYAKVRSMLSADECVIDPIGRLMDPSAYREMSPTARMRYVLELSKTYARLKERYYREKSRRE